ncbi:Hypothetical protein POVN_LOCUS193, partial [uncultured virus]
VKEPRTKKVKEAGPIVGVRTLHHIKVASDAKPTPLPVRIEEKKPALSLPVEQAPPKSKYEGPDPKVLHLVKYLDENKEIKEMMAYPFVPGISVINLVSIGSFVDEPDTEEVEEEEEDEKEVEVDENELLPVVPSGAAAELLAA